MALGASGIPTLPRYVNFDSGRPEPIFSAALSNISVGLQNQLVSLYSESGETTRLAGLVANAGSDPGAHTGFEHYAFVFESHPVGSGTNGPTNADYGMAISALKHNFATTTTVGEVDGLVVITRQGATGSDSTAYLANVAHYGTGNLSAFEGVSSIIVGASITQQVDSQIAVANNVTGVYLGFHTQAKVGTLGAAYHADSNTPSVWTYLFQGLQNGVQVFIVNADGTFATQRNNANTNYQLSLEQAGSGDATQRFLITSTRAWIMGIDNDDAQAFKIGPNDDGFASAVVRIDTGGTFAVSALRVNTAPTAVTHSVLIQAAADSVTNFGHVISFNLNGTTYYIPCGSVQP